MELSVWHKGLLDEKSIPLTDLRVGSLEGAGQAHHTAQDYFQSASEVVLKRREQSLSVSLSVSIEQRPEKADGLPQQWRDAHYEVYTVVCPDSDTSQCLQMFRNLLVAKARTLIPPDMYRDK